MLANGSAGCWGWASRTSERFARSWVLWAQAQFPPREFSSGEIWSFYVFALDFQRSGRYLISGGHPVVFHRIIIMISRFVAALSEPWHLQTAQYCHGVRSLEFPGLVVHVVVVLQCCRASGSGSVR